MHVRGNAVETSQAWQWVATEGLVPRRPSVTGAGGAKVAFPYMFNARSMSIVEAVLRSSATNG
jgi:hypothetical protein